ncbi:MAG: hypothetical protein Q4F76_05695 [Lachnospiraceae bacterium]|nr:hypothetical protein [Lachnospiraceae bacterium]
MQRKETFVIHITSQENSTWHGQITWLKENETRNFRSMLELIRLMDSALNQEEDEETEQGKREF